MTTSQLQKYDVKPAKNREKCVFESGANLVTPQKFFTFCGLSHFPLILFLIAGIPTQHLSSYRLTSHQIGCSSETAKAHRG
eukprot:TRINITY_DN273_c0_g1_i1.p1 TRINITY_DN273_c0_g1~~TRINITY_DN273_c0_g1_i1.p1  ORF type:complete len:81 (+),score=3.35 TRINITY_DN273_c0_g1_i1:244-486(+)